MKTDEWIKKILHTCAHTHTHMHTHRCTRAHTHIYTHVHTHTIEYYSAIEKNELMPFVTTWMDLEIITLNEVG